MSKREMLRALIKSTNGLFFSIHFLTKKGEKRELVMKDGVECARVFPKGVGSNNQEMYDNYITLFDMKAGRYKSVNLDTVTHLSCGNKVMWDE